MELNRRQMLQRAGLGAAALAFAPLDTFAADDKPAFTLPKLPYDYDALEPHIDKLTMEIHHDRHHQAYVTNLNKALEGHPDLHKKTLEQLLADYEKIPMEIRTAVINNGGGDANHTLFWEVMGPKAGGEPSGPLGKAITAAFGSFAKFQEGLSQKALTQFGSGWGWLVMNKGKLEIVSLPNQISPIMQGQTPLLGVDVWEHAYYLKYQNKRADYIKAWWNVVNWNNVATRHEKAMKG